MIKSMIQTTVKLIMLALNSTDSRTHSGLEVVFKADYRKENNILGGNYTIIFLWLSVLFSFISFVKSYWKIQKIEQKHFLPTDAKLMLGVRVLLVSLTRICAIVAYFAPSLGLFGLMSQIYI